MNSTCGRTKKKRNDGKNSSHDQNLDKIVPILRSPVSTVSNSGKIKNLTRAEMSRVKRRAFQKV
jgi:hypothetical protein